MTLRFLFGYYVLHCVLDYGVLSACVALALDHTAYWIQQSEFI